jgi:site-specific recombinase XerD
MPRHTDPRRRCLRISEWPERDRALWEAARDPSRRRFGDQPRQVKRAGAAWRKVAGGWGRYLSFLSQRGWLDLQEAPWERVTHERLDAFFFELLEFENADFTITGRFAEVQTALQVFQPRGDHRWVTQPHGIPISDYLLMRKRRLTLYAPIDLFLWGLELMNQAKTLRGARRRQVQMRDGLLIAILAFRGLRLRSVLSLTLGKNILRDADSGLWRLELTPDNVKNSRYINMRLPEILGPWLDRYMDVERRELLADNTSDAFWINWGGKPLREKGLDKRIRWQSAKRFGAAEAFGTHRFRHCIASSLPLILPEHPGLAASILHISHGVLDKHYDRSSAVLAFRAFHAALAQESKATREIAEKAFADRRRTSAARGQIGSGSSGCGLDKPKGLAPLPPHQLSLF